MLETIEMEKLVRKILISTCDMCATINNGLSAESMEQLKNKTGEEIVDTDIAAQMDATKSTNPHVIR